MANRSYCRFRNTEIDFMDCVDSLNYEGTVKMYVKENKTSKEEIYAMKRLYELAKQFVYDHEGEFDDIDELVKE